MQSHGYRIIPVNPTIKGALGEKAVSTLSEIKEKIDIVDVFRRPEAVPEVVDEAIQAGASAIWMQEGVVHEQAAAKARKAGIFVVMDKCILKNTAAGFRDVWLCSLSRAAAREPYNHIRNKARQAPSFKDRS